MVKAKFGALVLTVLMGLGAVSPLHGVTEAHALNAPVANSETAVNSNHHYKKGKE